MIRRMGDAVRAHAARDWRALAAISASDLTAVDHRQLGFPLSDATSVLEMMQALVELVPDAVLEFPTMTISGNVALVLAEPKGTTVDGSRYEWSMWFVWRMSGGLADHMEYFDADDAARAHARFEELAGRSRTSDVDNAAVRTMVRTGWLSKFDLPATSPCSRMRSEEPTTPLVRRMLHPLTDARAGPTSSPPWARRSRRGRPTSRSAVRGDRLALVAVRDGRRRLRGLGTHRRRGRRRITGVCCASTPSTRPTSRRARRGARSALPRDQRSRSAGSQRRFWRISSPAPSRTCSIEPPRASSAWRVSSPTTSCGSTPGAASPRPHCTGAPSSRRTSAPSTTCSTAGPSSRSRSAASASRSCASS